ncbi:MAG: hypothetical protein K2O18_01125, partial [Oscillospiraceae bacterium]|nr:hypothetical protein [Oscillospiraceae bacterium]
SKAAGTAQHWVELDPTHVQSIRARSGSGRDLKHFQRRYVCEKVMDTFLGKGFCTIGGLKSNRIPYPYGTKLSVSELAGKFEEAQCRELFHIVTVKGRRYWVYRYEGRLNKIENAVVPAVLSCQSIWKCKGVKSFYQYKCCSFRPGDPRRKVTMP